jgi:hypothetical protein
MRIDQVSQFTVIRLKSVIDAAGGAVMGACTLAIPTMLFIGECSGCTTAMMNTKPTHNIALICSIQNLKRPTLVGAKSTVLVTWRLSESNDPI